MSDRDRMKGMASSPCRSPISFDQLVRYWLDDLAEAQSDAIEEHFLGCDACAAELRSIAELDHGIRACAARGGMHAVVSESFVQEMNERGLRVREYRVPRNGSVRCTIAPDDDVLISRIEVPLTGVRRLDLEWDGDPAFAGARWEDVLFHAQSGAVLLANSVAFVRTLPEATGILRAFAVESGERSLLGEYTFHHTPFSGAGRDDS